MSPASDAKVCRLVIPAYNEAARIVRCLDAAARAPLPSGFFWQEWAVLDDASADGTPELADEWGFSHPDIPLRVIRNRWRSGKPTNLGSYHDQLLEGGRVDDVVIVVDADCAVKSSSLTSLVAPLSDKDRCAVTWGLDEADNTRFGHWASAFQMEAVTELARLVGLTVPRAYGRLFAYRVGALKAFTWRSGEISDDFQLARYVRRAAIPARTVEGARVLATPAGRSEDFYLQTFKFVAARVETSEPSESTKNKVRAGGRVALRHPMWAGAYGLASARASIRHRIRPAIFSATWTPPSSTKLALVDDQRTSRSGTFSSRATRIKSKLFYIRCTARTVRNWPSVLARYELSKSSIYTGDLFFDFRSGVKMIAPARPDASSPIFEVMVTDDYHLASFSRISGRGPDLIMDVGAHVGAASVFLGRCFPNAELVSYEPNAGSARYLRDNLRFNRIRAKVIEAAVGGRAGVARLVGEAESCRSMLSWDVTGTGTEVEVLSFREELRRAQSFCRTLIKMDCEGAEYEILDATSDSDWEAVEAILLEYHPVAGRGGWAEIHRRLTSFGFEVDWHENTRGRKDHDLGMAMFIRRAPGFGFVGADSRREADSGKS